MANVITADALSWDQSPLARQVRLAAQAVLIGAQTIAGTRVEDEPHDPFTDDQMPCIGIHSAQSRQNLSMAGGSVNLRLTLSIYIELFTIGAQSEDAVAQMDVLEAQVCGALLRDPFWPSMFGPLRSVSSKRQWSDGERIKLEGMIEIVGDGVIERYAPLITSALGPGGKPLQPLPVPIAVPLEVVDLTIENPQGGTLSVDTAITQPET